MIRATRERGLDGVICGHIHHAIISRFEDVTYANCGDWVESCTALAEDTDGKLKLLHWIDESFQLLDINNDTRSQNTSEKPYADSDTDGRVVPTS